MSKIAMSDAERREHKCERDRRSYLRNREAILARMAAYDAIPEHKAKQAANHVANRDRDNARTAAHHVANRDRDNARTAAWYVDNPGYNAAYHVANRDRDNARKAAYAAIPEHKAQKAARNATPEQKAQRAAYSKTPEQKAKYAAYLKTPAGKAAARRHHAKRRTLDFAPLNSWFPGSAAHHINVTDVIYVPSSMHRSIAHNVWTGRNMAAINALAYEYLALDPS
jgi:hypothetical protein